MQSPRRVRILESIDCFELSLLASIYVCIRYGHQDQSNSKSKIIFQINPDWRNTPGYRLIRRNDRKMKLIDVSDEDTEQESNAKPFNGTLEGVAITAALNWSQPDKEIVYFFAGRHLCRQEISFDWVPMCDIEDIADWLGCPKDEPKDGSFLLTLVIVLVLAFVVVVVILVIVFLWFRKAKSNEKPNPEPKPEQKTEAKPEIKSEPKSQQNVSNASELTNMRSDLN